MAKFNYDNIRNIVGGILMDIETRDIPAFEGADELKLIANDMRSPPMTDKLEILCVQVFNGEIGAIEATSQIMEILSQTTSFPIEVDFEKHGD